ncbi:hypothetical protein DFH06DRAFT_980885 [Mycena polygramma]|nr:hypothetical protein DFH06DRAFT_980885 [Mycena polygramma]
MEIDTDAPFIPADWIGKGKQYSDAPFAVIAAKNAVFALPAQATELIPPGSLSVTKFCDLALPRTSSELVYGESQMWFSKEEPTTDISLLEGRSIPPVAVLDLLGRKSGQAWLDGAKSIADPRFNDGKDRFPLGTLSFWKEMADIIKQQGTWKRGVQWVENERQKCKDGDTKAALEHVRAELETMGWKVSLTYDRGSTSTMDLADFLGSVWLGTTHIDMMMEDLADRVASDPELRAKVLVVRLSFSQQILRAKGKYTKNWAPELHQYEREVKDEGKEKIIFPVNIGNKHWVTGEMDFKNETIGFGLFQPPKNLINGLKNWGRCQFGITFQWDYDALEHGVQRDGYSCGIVAPNTAERRLYPDTPLWIPRMAVFARVQRFLRYVKHQKESESEAAASDRMSFATSSGVDGADWDKTSESAMGDAEVSVAEEETKAGPSTSLDDAGSAMEVDIPPDEPVAPPARDESKSRKATKQTSLFGFFASAGSKPAVPKAKEEKKRRHSDDVDGSAGTVPTMKKQKSDRASTSATPTNVGISRTAKASQAVMKQLRSGEFTVDPVRYENFKRDVRDLDPHAEFLGDANTADIRSIRHSKCGKIVKGKQPYEVSQFRAHARDPKGCRAAHRGAGMSTLTSLFAGATPSKPVHSNPAVPTEKPCPGITENDIPNVEAYLKRSGAMGGGSRSVFKIASEKFSKAFSALGTKRRKEVQDTQYHEQMWRNDHHNLRVFSTDCKKTVMCRGPRACPCSSCSALLTRKSFKKTLKKKAPDPKNYIYTNAQYKNQLLGEIYGRSIGLQDIIEQPNAKNTPCVRYAQGVLEGTYNNQVFNGLVEAMVTKADREERGVGMQNFKYAPAYDEFCNVIRISSPAAYRAFQEHLPGRSERSFRAKEAREPRFPMDISDRNFKLAAEHLAALNYDGPVNLSCDDTKLFPSFRLYWDSDKKSHFLVGGTDGPLRVADPEQVKSVIATAKAKKATKIRLWCLTIPVPGVTPIIVAALPIANDLKADVLLRYLVQVVNGLLDHKIKVVLYACDGTQIERSVQDLFVKQADETIKHVIKDPRGKGPPLTIIIAVVRGQSICMIQDSKHALKTFRNNLFSGAQLLALGSYTAIYSRIREMAFADGSPLFHRDVEKLDRQDDNAATRLFSADTLKYLADHHPEYLGEIVYLFIFGELIDAYQNRSISHAERVKLVLRARYVLDSWSASLEISGYNKSLYFLSREAVDIARIIIEGYLALSRRIVKDFTMLDFLYMIPKLRVKIRAAVLRAKASDPKARAAGYSHTYFDNTGLDILALSTFPTDDDIDCAAAEAAEESDSLIALLGLAPSHLHPGAVSSIPVLPSIDSWYNVVEDEDSASDSGSISEAQQLQDLIDQAEELVEDTTARHPRKQTQELLNLTSAALALTADDMIKIHTSNDNEAEILDEVEAEEHSAVQALKDAIPTLSISEPSKPLGQASAAADTIDFDYLVELRRHHQTVQAARGVRTRVLDWSSEKAKDASLRQQLIKKLHLALKEGTEQEIAPGTGLVRKAHWVVPAPGGRGGNVPTTAGNSANAALAATTLAKKAATKRKDVFTKARVPNLPESIHARVTLFCPLHLGDYGVVLTARGLMIGHIFGMHCKGGGKYGRHEPVSDSSNISALSKISVQLFEKIHGTQFHAIPTATSVLQTRQFAHIPPINFLCVLSSIPKLLPTGLELGAEDSDRFKKLSQGLDKFNTAMTLFRKRGKKTTGAGAESDDDDEEDM